MKDPVEPRERLRAANPVSVTDAPSPDSPKAAELFRRITATEPRGHRLPKRSWQRPLWLLVPAALLAAAAGYGLVHKVTNPLLVACYSRPALSGTISVVSSGTGGPAAACADLWQPGGSLNPGGGRPPQLVSCVMPTGIVGVFPSAQGVDTCGTLGLAPSDGPAQIKGDDAAILAVQEAVSEAFLARCVGRNEAVSIAEQQLAGHKMRGWNIVAATPFTNGEPCASLHMDVPRKTISIIPVSDSS
jgi:hypothetical protein